ncbi:hypothetical protein SSX86_032636 [Deinandra increscens subsp. villosa]|uniref:Longin domain-containing protein n=1 Tax=Deinandra increscens subsp. villosa TaxID=3103831 RepID=A0AAP0GH35_9ASTR
MVNLTIVGRTHDGLPISQGPIYDQDDVVYKKHAEFLLHEISMAALPPSTTTIFLHHHCFNYMICRKNLTRLIQQLVSKIIKPYSFVKFDNIICKIRRQYIDTRTQTNLSKLNANHHKQEPDVFTEKMSVVIERRRRSDMLERMMKAHKSTSSMWDSNTLEVIAAKWTPVTIIFVVAFVLLWSSFKA